MLCNIFPCTGYYAQLEMCSAILHRIYILLLFYFVIGQEGGKEEEEEKKEDNSELQPLQ